MASIAKHVGKNNNERWKKKREEMKKWRRKDRNNEENWKLHLPGERIDATRALRIRVRD